MAERKSGAGSHLSGVLERATPPRPEVQDVPQPDDVAEPDAVAGRGRGGASRKAPKAADARAAKKIKGRTIYLPDDLFERVLVQAHRKNKRISEYVAAILERQVPDHRVVRSEPAEPDAA